MPLLEEDLNHVRRNSEGVWREMQGKRIFVTGGSGFIGRWLVESLLYANRTLHLGVYLVILTRSAARFREASPHLAVDSALSLVEGDIKDFALPVERFDYLIHAAADTRLTNSDPTAAINNEVAGFHRTFSFAVKARVSRVLFVSSGAVYATRTTNEPISEDASCDLDQAKRESRYGEVKRLGELYGGSYAAQFGLDVIFGRCFSMFGPYQDLESHFAIANFLRDALAGSDIIVRGDGLDQRSYLYAADLAIWLWHLLIFGESRAPYNVGSDIPISLSDLASVIARVAGAGSRVRVLGGARQGLAGSIYLPNVDKARRELGLGQLIGLEEGIRRTLRWNRQ